MNLEQNVEHYVLRNYLVMYYFSYLPRVIFRIYCVKSHAAKAYYT